MKFLTSAARIEQLPEPGMYKLIDNELYLDDDKTINLHWRNFVTDNYTYIKSGERDIRCAHGHDIGCKHHQIVKVKLSISALIQYKYLHKNSKGLWVCENIPPEHLEIVNVSGRECNNLFYRMMRDADCPITPKYLQYWYRAGVSFNLNWFKTGKIKIDLAKLYDENWNKRENV